MRGAGEALEKISLEPMDKVYNIRLKGCEWKSGIAGGGSKLEHNLS